MRWSLVSLILATSILATSLVADASPGALLWRTTARIDDGSTLRLAVCSDQALPQVVFHAGSDAAPAPIERRRSGEGVLTTSASRIAARDWRRGECLLARVDVDALVQRADRVRRAPGSASLLLDPRHWLWRPTAMHPDSTIRFELPAGWSASVPWTPVRDEAYTYRLGPTAADWPALTAFGPFAEQRRAFPGGTLRIAILPPWQAHDIARIEPVAQALLQAYGALPRPDTQVLVAPLRGQREAAPWGQVLRGGGAAVHLFAGADASPDALIRDWTATHEFAHLLHPYLGGRGRWLSEGLASYYQNVLRARHGTLSADQAWERIEAGFARGARDTRAAGLTLDAASRRLGSVRSYMRVYWSGAAFWLEAELDLRARGSSLDAVLQAYAKCCLAEAVDADVEGFMRALDAIAGSETFLSRQRRYAQLTSFPDIEALRARAKADAVRAAIMAPRAVATSR
jgi:hypothetical protein